jgi:hypothetical protein
MGLKKIWIIGIGFKILMQCLCFVLKILNPIFCNTYVKLVLHEIVFNVFQP